MKIVYCHNRKPNIRVVDHPIYTAMIEHHPKGGSTVAMEAVQSWLLDQLKMGDTIVRKVGIARCSDDDNYCKKTGRELAESRLKTTTLKVVNQVAVCNTGYLIVFFEDEKGNLFEFKKTNDPDCARLVRMLDD